MPENKKMHNGQAMWTPARLAFTIIVLSLFAAFGVSSCSSGDERRPEPAGSSAQSGPVVVKSDPVPVTKNAPPAPALVTALPASVVNVELRAMTGAPIKLSNYGGKVLLVNLWATWCGPCRLETPELVKLYKEFRSKGLEVVGLSTEDPDATTEAVKRFVQDHNVNYRIGWATPDVSLTLMQGREAIPQSFIISRTGKVLKRFVGFNPNSTPALIKEAVEEALNEKAAAD
jgi:thiol-disulfide isomerase/thioredoxin